MEFFGMLPWEPDVGIVEIQTSRGVVDLYNFSTLEEIQVVLLLGRVRLQFATPLGRLRLEFSDLQEASISIEKGALSRVDFSQVDLFGHAGDPFRDMIVYLTVGDISMRVGRVAATFDD